MSVQTHKNQVQQGKTDTVPSSTPPITQPTSPSPTIEPKSNAEGLAEHAERLKKFQRLDSNMVQMGPPRLGHSNPIPIQPKLTIGAPGDKYEQEADRVAKQVVTQIHSPKSPNPSSSAQRQNLPERDELMMKPLIQRHNGPKDATPNLEQAINQSRGGGRPLDEKIRGPMEQAFRANFGNVRVHSDTKAHQLNESIQARAFTTGQDLFFRQGAYQPGNRAGQELLAHELTHVVQQNGVLVKESKSSNADLQKSNAVVQAQWVAGKKAETWYWDQVLDGVTWYMDSSNSMWFQITNAEAITTGTEEEYTTLQGKKNKKSWIEWNALSVAPLGGVGDLLFESMQSMQNEDFEWGSNTLGGPLAKKLATQPPRKYGNKATPLALWLYKKDEPEPKVFNCWEAVLIAAFKAGLIDKNYIKKAIVIKGGVPAFVKPIMDGPSGKADGPLTKDKGAIAKIPFAISTPFAKGVVVAFGTDPGHVALATGKRVSIKSSEVAQAVEAEEGNEILELDSVTEGVSKSTIEETMARNTAYTRQVCWGPLPSSF